MTPEARNQVEDMLLSLWGMREDKEKIANNRFEAKRQQSWADADRYIRQNPGVRIEDLVQSANNRTPTQKDIDLFDKNRKANVGMYGGITGATVKAGITSNTMRHNATQQSTPGASEAATTPQPVQTSPTNASNRGWGAMLNRTMQVQKAQHIVDVSNKFSAAGQQTRMLSPQDVRNQRIVTQMGALRSDKQYHAPLSAQKGATEQVPVQYEIASGAKGRAVPLSPVVGGGVTTAATQMRPGAVTTSIAPAPQKGNAETARPQNKIDAATKSRNVGAQENLYRQQAQAFRDGGKTPQGPTQQARKVAPKVSPAASTSATYMPQSAIGQNYLRPTQAQPSATTTQPNYANSYKQGLGLGRPQVQPTAPAVTPAPPQVASQAPSPFLQANPVGGSLNTPGGLGRHYGSQAPNSGYTSRNAQQFYGAKSAAAPATQKPVPTVSTSAVPQSPVKVAALVQKLANAGGNPVDKATTTVATTPKAPSGTNTTGVAPVRAVPAQANVGQLMQDFRNRQAAHKAGQATAPRAVAPAATSSGATMGKAPTQFAPSSAPVRGASTTAQAVPAQTWAGRSNINKAVTHFAPASGRDPAIGRVVGRALSSYPTPVMPLLGKAVGTAAGKLSPVSAAHSILAPSQLGRGMVPNVSSAQFKQHQMMRSEGAAPVQAKAVPPPSAGSGPKPAFGSSAGAFQRAPQTWRGLSADGPNRMGVGAESAQQFAPRGSSLTGGYGPGKGANPMTQGVATTKPQTTQPPAGQVTPIPKTPTPAVPPTNVVVGQAKTSALIAKLTGHEKVAVTLAQLRVASSKVPRIRAVFNPQNFTLSAGKSIGADGVRGGTLRGATDSADASVNLIKKLKAANPQAGIQEVAREEILPAVLSARKQLAPFSGKVYVRGDMVKYISKAAPDLGIALPKIHAANKEVVNRTILLHEGAEARRDGSVLKFHTHNSAKPVVNDLNIAATLKEHDGAADYLRALRAPEVGSLSKISPSLSRLDLGHTRVSRHAVKRIQQAYERNLEKLFS